MAHILKIIAPRGTKTLLSIRNLHTNNFRMALSRFEYVKSFETSGVLDPAHWIVISLNCQNVDTIAQVHHFHRPNDVRFSEVMEASALSVMDSFKELVLSYGYWGEFNFAFAKNTTLYKRRGPKLLTNICSLMASSFVNLWPPYFDSVALGCLPVFNGVIHLLPEDQMLRDFLTLRQRACHRRNLHNTVLWAMVSRDELAPEDAAKALKGTNEAEQNELLFSRFNLNYNNESDLFKKGVTAVRRKVLVDVRAPDGSIAQRNQSKIVTMHTDFVKDEFWTDSSVTQTPTMKNAKTGYVKAFEKNDKLLPQTWLVVRIDGKGFHRFSEIHNFAKPNDIRSIELMNRAANVVMTRYPDIVLSYGQSDEYSFVIHKNSNMNDRRENTLIANIVSLFAAKYVSDWEDVFGDTKLQYCPAFDARVVLYPNDRCLKDYLSWRQADCHINNMYNTCFWKLVLSNEFSRREAEQKLCGTLSDDKRSILIDKFDVDYNDEEAIYRKGTIIIRTTAFERDCLIKNIEEFERDCSTKNTEDDVASSSIAHIRIEHVDIINESFWKERSWLISSQVV